MESWDFTILGTHEKWGEEIPLALSTHSRRQHVYVVGKTGSGKTTLLRNMIVQDIMNGRGVGVIDPHGDLAAEILEHIPPHRTDDVVYFNPSDFGNPIGFNLLPEKFTLPEIHDLYETILGKTLDRRNFPKKLLALGIIKKLDEQKNIGAHRSPYLYKFDKRKYDKALKEGISV